MRFIIVRIVLYELAAGGMLMSLILINAGESDSTMLRPSSARAEGRARPDQCVPVIARANSLNER